MTEKLRFASILIVVVIFATMTFEFIQFTGAMKNGPQVWKIEVFDEQTKTYDVYYANDFCLKGNMGIYNFKDSFGRQHLTPVVSTKVTKLK